MPIMFNLGSFCTMLLWLSLSLKPVVETGLQPSGEPTEAETPPSQMKVSMARAMAREEVLPTAPAESSVLEMGYRKLLQAHGLSDKPLERISQWNQGGGEGADSTREAGGLEVSRRQQAPVSELQQVGYRIFDNITGSPPINRDFPANAQVGVGDLVQISLTGSVEESHECEIDSQLQVFFPKVGTLSLRGLSFGQSEEKLRKSFMEYYKQDKVYVVIKSQVTRTVMVLGEVKSPGLKAMPGSIGILEALFLAGGVSKSGSLRQIQIRGHESREVVDLYELLFGGEASSPILRGGETLFIPPLLETAAIVGEVQRPGIYEISGNGTLAGLLKLAQGVTPTGYPNRVNLYRVSEDHHETGIQTLEADDFEGFKLESGDIVQVMARPLRTINAFKIEGAVNLPGSYQVLEGMTLAQAIEMAGGLAMVHGNSLILMRTFAEGRELMVSDQRASTIYRRSLDFDLRSGDMTRFTLTGGDEIFIPERGAMYTAVHVRVVGEVLQPGELPYMDNLNLHHAISLAGGLSNGALLDELSVARLTDTGNVVMHKVFEGRPADLAGLRSFFLEPGDTVTVPSLGTSTILVSSSGEFVRPGAYMLRKGARLSDLIEASGGFKPEAYARGCVFHRLSVAEVYNRQLGQLADRMEQSLLRSAIDSEGGALSAESQAASVSISARQARLLEKIRSTTSPGRIALDLPDNLVDFESSKDNIPLEEGDRLRITGIPGTVHILGQVNNQNTVAFQGRALLSDYIDLAGGYTKHADKDNVFIIRANGKVIPAKNFRRDRSWIQGRDVSGNKLTVEPGDTILVPEDFEIKPNSLVFAKDITQIMFQIITSVGVAVAAF